jgi:hypothetical protein
MVGHPRRYAGIEAGACRRRRILSQSIEDISFGKNILNLVFCGIKLFRLQMP